MVATPPLAAAPRPVAEGTTTVSMGGGAHTRQSIAMPPRRRSKGPSLSGQARPSTDSSPPLSREGWSRPARTRCCRWDGGRWDGGRLTSLHQPATRCAAPVLT